MRISLGYPSLQAEMQLIKSVHKSRCDFQEIATVMDPRALENYQDKLNDITISDSIIEYILRLVNYTRSSQQFSDSLSPRASIALAAASKAYAFISGRDFVLPDDVQAVFAPVCAHRLGVDHHNCDELMTQILQQVAVH